MAAIPRAPLMLALAALSCLAVVTWFALEREPIPGDVEQPIGLTGEPELGDEPIRASAEVAMERGSRLDRSASAATDPLPADRRRVRGRLLDAGGKPLAEALIGEIAAAEPALASDDGRFEVFAGRGPQRIELLAIAADHAPSRFEHNSGDAPASQTIDLGDLRMSAGGAIRGRVHDESGKALSDAEVKLTPGSDLAWLQALDFEQMAPPAKTDRDGSFAFARLAPGRYDLAVHTPGKLTAVVGTTVVEGNTSELNSIAVRAAHDLFGRVIDPAGNAVAEAGVRAGTSAWVQNVLGTAMSAADGTFRISQLPAGSLWVEVKKDGYAIARKTAVDPSRGEELLVQLEAGLRITGVVVDAESRSPIERFAMSIRRTGEVDAQAKGAPPLQIARRLAALREEMARITDEAERLRKQRLETELIARLARVTELSRTRPVASSAQSGEPEVHALGRFALEGLDEGIYAIRVEAPDYAPAAAEAVEVRRSAAPPELSIELRKVPQLSGRVVAKESGAPIEGAAVELHRVMEAADAERRIQRSLYGWIFAPAGPRGVILATMRTGADGRFVIRGTEGRAVVSVRAAGRADHETEAFEPAQVAAELRIALGACAQLRGRVRDAPAAMSGEIEVVLLGGRGAMLTAKAAADRTYAFERLQPGKYLVRAFPAGARAHFNRFFSALFPLHAGAVDPARVPQPDVVLAEGESKSFDVVLELPPMGGVEGAVTLNGRPVQGTSAALRPIEAPGAGGLSIQGPADERGRFAMQEVPVGRYNLELMGPTRQVLHAEELRVDAGAVTSVERDLAAGGVRGRLLAREPVAAADFRGTVWILPDVAEAPADLNAYRKLARTHRMRVRDGKFEDAWLTPGPALVVTDIAGWKRVSRAISVPAGGILECDLELEGRASQ